MGLFSRKKALNLERAHELQPCVLLKYTPITAEHHSRPLDETPGGADETRKSMRRRLLNFFRRKTGKYNLVKAEKVYQNAAESYQRLNDGQTSLQHMPIVKIDDHQEPPVSEVLPDIEKLLEQDIPQPQDVDTAVSLTEEDKAEEQDKDQTSLQQIVEIHEQQDAPVSEVLITAEEQLEQDVLQFQDINTPVSSSEDDEADELDKDRTSLQQIVEIHEHQEAPVSEVLITAEEQLEQDILQFQDINTPVSSSENDKADELDKDHTSPQQSVEIHDLGESVSFEVLPAAEEQLEQDAFQLQDVLLGTSVSSSEDDGAEELNKDQTTSLQLSVEIHDLGEAPSFEVLPASEEQLEQDFHCLASSTDDDDEAEEPDNSHIFWHYEFGQKLGEGGFGCVHAGTRCKDGLKVAVKIAEKTPNMPYIRVPGHPKRLPMEIGLTLMANQGPSMPQIIKLLDWQDDPDHYVMVLERPMPSMSLLSFMKPRRRLVEGMARHFMRQVIEAAKICCERGVFHRDIKLENLLVNPDTLEVKLIDFGCGTLMKDSAYMSFSGTEMFCPPEFYAEGRYHAKPATVWSLGILLFAVLCGYYPDDKDRDVMSKKEWSKPELSQECYNMVCACLQPDPQQRLILEEMLLHNWFKVVE
ncbi:hypothetical protein QQF64_030519 [Cirrhinus molitorella]|uniref:non-specific serine/threonine protein kinase n=1 Tax=Cirrhinus molitorella TaxID=172907 RepID=A0ABR3N3K7_9TELE